MLRLALLIALLTWAVPASCADAGSGGSLMPEGVRAIATPDDCAIILVSDPTNGAGTGLQWIGVAGAIACNADNSIIVWSGGYAPPALSPPVGPSPVPQSPTAPPASRFLWPEGVEYAAPFDLDNSIIIRSDGE